MPLDVQLKKPAPSSAAFHIVNRHHADPPLETAAETPDLEKGHGPFSPSKWLSPRAGGGTPKAAGMTIPPAAGLKRSSSFSSIQGLVKSGHSLGRHSLGERRSERGPGRGRRSVHAIVHRSAEETAKAVEARG